MTGGRHGAGHGGTCGQPYSGSSETKELSNALTKVSFFIGGTLDVLFPTIVSNTHLMKHSLLMFLASGPQASQHSGRAFCTVLRRFPFTQEEFTLLVCSTVRHQQSSLPGTCPSAHSPSSRVEYHDPFNSTASWEVLLPSGLQYGVPFKFMPDRVCASGAGWMGRENTPNISQVRFISW